MKPNKQKSKKFLDIFVGNFKQALTLLAALVASMLLNTVGAVQIEDLGQSLDDPNNAAMPYQSPQQRSPQNYPQPQQGIPADQATTTQPLVGDDSLQKNGNNYRQNNGYQQNGVNSPVRTPTPSYSQQQMYSEPPTSSRPPNSQPSTYSQSPTYSQPATNSKPPSFPPPPVYSKPPTYSQQPTYAQQPGYSQPASSYSSPSYSEPQSPQSQPTSQSMPSSSAYSNLPPNQRISRLEQLLQNLTNMNMPQQINELQHQLQTLNGKLEEQSHQIQILTVQVQQLKNQQATTQDSKNKMNDALSSAGDANKAAEELPSDEVFYQKAIDQMSNKQYSEAQTTFQQYLQKYPKGHYLANVHYWLGELYMLNNILPKAAAEFNIVVSQFATYSKVSDARLKLAMIHARLGQNDLARQEFTQVKKLYPNSTSAHLADIELHSL